MLWRLAARRSLSTSTSTSTENLTAQGTKNWRAERIASMLTFGLIGAACYAPSQPIDIALGIVLPVHCHLGFDSIVTDYVPKRKKPILHGLCMSFLYAGTAATIYGLWELNTKDIGITRGVQKLLFASEEEEAKK